MNHITSLPQNLNYLPSNDLKEDGTPIMVLDISKTHVQMIPAKLQGVDRVIARENQIKYIAPGYNGEVVEKGQHMVGTGVFKTTYTTLKEGKILELKKAFGRSMQFLTKSYKANLRCQAYPAEEMNLPAALKFSWSNKRMAGTLDARMTWITETPKILNIDKILVPSAEVLAKLYQKESKLNKIREQRNKRRDWGLIRNLTGELYKR